MALTRLFFQHFKAKKLLLFLPGCAKLLQQSCIPVPRLRYNQVVMLRMPNNMR